MKINYSLYNSLIFGIIITSLNHFELELLLILVFVLYLLLVRADVLIIFSLAICWISSTKFPESDLYVYHEVWDMAKYFSYFEYISINFKSPLFYSYFFFCKSIGLSFRSTIFILTFFGNQLFKKISEKLFKSNIISQIVTLLFIFYYPIFDSSTHLIRQHLASVLLIYALVYSPRLIGIPILVHLSSAIPSIGILSTKFLRWYVIFILFISVALLFFIEPTRELLQILYYNKLNKQTIFLQDLGLLEYSICVLTLIPLLVSRVYRIHFMIPWLSIFIFAIVNKENSEVLFRIIQYYHYLVPIALGSIFVDLFINVKNGYIVTNTVMSLLLAFNIFIFLYKFLFDNTWIYFYAQ